MALIADLLLVAATLALAFYCIVLSRRLARFSDLEQGMGGAVAVLSAQVDDMTKALEKARASASASATALEALTGRAETAAHRLELMIAATHDVSGPEAAAPPARAHRTVQRRTRPGLTGDAAFADFAREAAE